MEKKLKIKLKIFKNYSIVIHSKNMKMMNSVFVNPKNTTCFSFMYNYLHFPHKI